MNEFKRLINRKILLCFIMLILLNTFLYVYQQVKGESINNLRFKTNQREWLVEYYGHYHIDEAVEVIQSDISDIQSYRNQGDDNSAVVLYDNTSEVVSRYKAMTAHNQNMFFSIIKEIKTQLEYIRQYPEDMKQIQTNAQELMTFSIFADKDSFTYNNIVKTGKDFERVKDEAMYLVNNKATEYFVDYYYIFYFSLLMMVFIIYRLSGERDNEMWSIVHTAKNGRLQLAFHRFMIITVASIAVTAGLYFTTYIASLWMYGGLSSLNAPVQTIPSFSRFSIPMSQISYVFYNYIYSALAVLVISILLWMVFVINRKRNHALIFTGIFIGLEVLLYYKIQNHSVYAVFKQINIVRLMKVNEIISTYANRGKGTFVISESAIIGAVLLVMLCVSSVICFAGTIVMRPLKHQSFLSKILEQIYMLYQHFLANVSVTMKELHKLIITGRGITVILVMMIVVWYFVGYGKMTFSDSARERDKIYREKGGADYSEIVTMINERKNEYIEISEKARESYELYENGQIELEEVTRINSQVTVYASRYAALREFEEKYRYLLSLKEETGVDGYMISDRGYEEIFGEYGTARETVILIALLVSVVLIVSENIEIETRTGTKYITNASYGRNMIKVKRLIASALLVIFLFVIVYGIDMLCMYKYYGMPYMDAPLMSLMFMRDCGLQISIGTYIMLRLMIRFALMSVVFATTYVICGGLSGIRGRISSVFIIIASVIAAVVLNCGVGS